MAQDERKNPNPRSGDSPSRFGERRPRFSVWIYLVVFIALLVHFFVFLGGTDPNELEYSTFLDYAEKGFIENVTIINDARVEGEYTEDAVREGSVQVGQPPQNWLGNTTPGETSRAFMTVKPDDHELTPFLRENNIQFEAQREENWLGGMLTWVLPLIIIVALWMFLIRRMNPGSQVLNIGKNKATLYDALSNQQINFRDVAGLDEAKEEVQEIVEFLENPKRFTRLGGKLPKGVLLVGPPGTGKTLLGKAVAGEAGVPFFSLSGSDFVEMFVGVGAARVRDLFRQAKEKAPCIIFIDEIDAIGRQRGRGMMMGANDERENTLNQILVEMDGFNTDKGVIIMAATNRPDVLDNALLRPGRFDRQILIDKPDRNERAAIFKVHTRNLILGSDVNHMVLASQTPGFAGAEIANVCNEAAILAARLDKDAIEMSDFEKSIDRVIGGLEKKNKLISPEERKIVAYHEAGHAITGWFLKNTAPVIKVSIVPRGLAALGYAQSLPEERYISTQEAFMDQMTMMIGGRVAEEIIFDHLSTGAQNDLERITKLAYAMVVDYGMSERMGHISFNLSGRDQSSPMFDKPYSDETARLIDQEVKSIIGEVHKRAHAMLDDKADLLESMSQALLKKEVLGPRDLVELLGERPHGEYVAYGPPEGDGAATTDATPPVPDSEPESE
ncbi:MAG: ATP-dependent zinc metalloprotease FtsH [Rhodothermales bacterium]